jgi:hypothetical protein
MNPLYPLLALLLPSILILLVGLAVLLAARRRPRTVSALIGVVVVTGFGALGYAASSACAEVEAVRWVIAGLALVILGCPAWVLVPAGGAQSDTLSGAGAVAEVVKLLFGYLAACWFFAIAVGIFVHLTTSPPGSFR